MRYRVIWSDEAREALRSIYVRREAFQTGAGKRMVRRIRKHVNTLESFPESGRILPEAGLPVLREKVVPPYRVLYRLYNDRVEIVTCGHGALDLNLEE